MPIASTRSRSASQSSVAERSRSSAAARFGQQLDRVDRQDALRSTASRRTTDSGRARRPDRPRPRSRGRQIASMLVSANATAASERIRDAQRLQRILKAHQAEPDRAVPQVRAARLRDGVEIDVDDVVEHPHRGRDRALQPARDRARRRATWSSRLTEPRLQTATSSSEVLSVISVQRFDECTTPHMLLRRAQVAGVLERDPRMPGLEQHGQHAPPQIDGAHLLGDAHLAARRPWPRRPRSARRTACRRDRADPASRRARTASIRRRPRRAA